MPQPDFFISKVHPDDYERIYEFFNKSIENPKSIISKSNTRFMRNDGSYANILDRFNVIWNNGPPLKKLGDAGYFDKEIPGNYLRSKRKYTN